ncbi:MAG TPA: RNA polymerase sigma factor [Gemmatimonadaceae bacterium]|nr:RNA polymerase sigma factor [Gemmatimonadaceae bacterium]
MTARLELVYHADRNNDLSLARAACAGDERAFERIYQAHAGRVHALCLRMSGSRTRAAELTQDVFVHVWRNLAKWRGESALSSWIHRLTINLVLSNARSEQRRLKHEMSDSIADGSDTADDEPRRASPGAQAPADVLNAIDLERAIAELPPGARTVFVLHDVEGYRHDEIAKLTGTAEGTCRAQLHRARRLLMDALGGER